MQTAAYTTVKTANNGEGKYPLSTQTLEFIQQQILLLQEMVAICGGKVIIREPDGIKTGLLALDGEVLHIAPTPKLTTAIKYVLVTTKTSDILADGETYKEARTVRTAKFSAELGTGQNTDTYKIGDFKLLSSNTTLAEKINNMPSIVLDYLSDTLANKVDRLTLTHATQAQIDGLITACVVECVDSVAVQGFKTYCITAKRVGNIVEQILTPGNGTEYYRAYSETTKKWTSWSTITDNMHIEVKTVGNTVYVRHGVLPPDANIIFLRKKKRSGWRRTGGAKSYTANKGKRIPRQKKLQYVHFKGVILSKGEPGKWYVPKCIAVANKNEDAILIDREISFIAGQLVKQGKPNANGGVVYKLAGVRKYLTKTQTGKNFKRSGYINLAVQVAKLNGNGGKDAGGELARFKLRCAPKRVKYNSFGTLKYKHVYVRTFSVE